MTVTEFSRKYGIEYSMVYNASGKLVMKGLASGNFKTGSRLDYDEEALREVVLDEAKRRCETCERNLEKAMEILKKCGG